MRAIFVNSVHPLTKHVAALRLSRFAQAMAARGHEIVLLTPTLDGSVARPPEFVLAALKSHDWRAPLHVEFGTTPNRVLDAIRQNTIPAVLRRPLTALYFTAVGGVHGDRVTGSRPFWPILAGTFRPHLVWSTFGDTGNLLIGQALARSAGVPWLIDVKDNWRSYLRPGIRTLVARRFHDAAALTSNAELHLDIAKQWHRQRSCVVYSGAADEMVAKGSLARPDRFQIMMVGSIRDQTKLRHFLLGLRDWVASKSATEQQLIDFRYAGGAAQMVTDTLRAINFVSPVLVQTYLPLGELGRVCQAAGLNCYIWAPQTFHHKLLELVACRRPVIAFPGEHDESRRLAKAVGAAFFPCTDTTELTATLEMLFRRWHLGQEPISRVNVDMLGWDAMTVRLEAFMQSVIEEGLGERPPPDGGLPAALRSYPSRIGKTA